MVAQQGPGRDDDLGSIRSRQSEEGNLELGCGPDVGELWVVDVEGGEFVYAEADDRPVGTVMQEAEMLPDLAPVLPMLAVVGASEFESHEPVELCDVVEIEARDSHLSFVFEVAVRPARPDQPATEGSAPGPLRVGRRSPAAAVDGPAPAGGKGSTSAAPERRIVELFPGGPRVCQNG